MMAGMPGGDPFGMAGPGAGDPFMMAGMPGGDPYGMGGMPGFGGMPGDMMGGMMGGMPGDMMGGMMGGMPGDMMGGMMGGMPGDMMGGMFGDMMGGMPEGDPYGMVGMMLGDPEFDLGMMMGGPVYEPAVYDPVYDPAYDPAFDPIHDLINGHGPGEDPYDDELDLSVPGAITGTSNPNEITATEPDMVLTGAGGGDDLSNGGFAGVIFNYESDLAVHAASGKSRLWGEAYFDTINGGGIDPMTGMDTDPFSGEVYHGEDKGLGVDDILRFASADLYYGSTQLSSVSGTLTIGKSVDASFSGSGQIGDVCLFDAQYVGGTANNLIFAIDANGNGTLEGDDVMFDVEDDALSSNQMVYDSAQEVFTFV